MTLYLPGRRPIDLSRATEIGSGAGGMVFAYPEGAGDLFFKLYLDPNSALERRFHALRRLPPARWEEEGGAFLSWPRADLTDDSGQLVGFDMPRAEGRTLYGLVDPRQRDEVLDMPTWGTLVHVAERVARMTARLHHSSIVIGDVSPANILVDPGGRATFIDCDSYQFVDPQSRERFPALNITPEYASPGAAGTSTVWLDHHHDEFGLAIILCQLLMEGDHPYEGVPRYGADGGVPGNILTGTSRHFGPHEMQATSGAIGVDILPEAVRELAHRCFHDGHADPAVRPSASEWSTTLQRVSGQLVGCHRNPRHVTWSGRGGCFWCDRTRAGFGEYYPARGSRRPPGGSSSRKSRSDRAGR